APTAAPRPGTTPRAADRRGESRDRAAVGGDTGMGDRTQTKPRRDEQATDGDPHNRPPSPCPGEAGPPLVVNLRSSSDLGDGDQGRETGPAMSFLRTVFLVERGAESDLLPGYSGW